MLLRDLVAGDEQALREAFEHADPRVLRARFGGGVPPFAAVADRLRRLDGVSRYAVGVFDGDDVIGVGEYVQAVPDSPAEVALVVHQDWQRHGIGRAVLLARSVPGALRVHLVDPTRPDGSPSTEAQP